MTIEYRGHKFPGYNKPIKAPAGDSHKMMVLAKKGDEVKLVRFGARGYSDYTQHKDEKRRENFKARFGGIKQKDGSRAIDDIFSPAYWANKVLW
jgi:hypothetical protein